MSFPCLYLRWLIIPRKKSPRRLNSAVRALHSLPCSTPPGCCLKSCPLTLNYWPWLGSEHMLLSHLYFCLCQLVAGMKFKDYVNKFICTFFFKIPHMSDIKELIYKIEIETQMQRRKWQLSKGKKGRNGEIGTDIYTLLYIKSITDKDLLYSRGNSIECSVVT